MAEEASLHFDSSSAQTPGEARSFLVATLFFWGRRTDIPFIELVASELVTNAVQHVGGEIDYRLRLDDETLRIEVADRASDRPPVVLNPLPNDEHGRGLRLVDAVSTTWGSTPDGVGKTVWAELDLNPTGLNEPSLSG
jgi:hypothetical protein